MSTKTEVPGNINWESELNATAFKYNVLIAWVAVILNPIWVIPDYFNLPQHFNDFLAFRIVVSILTLVGILMRNKFRENPAIIAFIPFLGISIQNAYMYSVMNVAEIEKHTFAYIALFIGAGMFVLWKPVYSIVIVILSFIANIVFFSINSNLQVGEILINGGMLTASVALFTILLINTRMNLTKKEIIARLSLAESNKQLEEKNLIIEEKNKDITDSINYAQRIQHAVLPHKEHMDKVLRDYFVLYRPKDVISGDFYWFADIHTTPSRDQLSQEIAVIAAVDCTGHGVPGALMSIMGSAILNQTTSIAEINSPGDALNFLNRELNENLKGIKDGMDIAMIAINFHTHELQYAGAHNSIYIVRNKEIIELKPDKMAIGADSDDAINKNFTNKEFKLIPNDTIYLFTDGYADQFGGPKGKKFTYKKFQQLLIDIHDLPMDEQRNQVEKYHNDWKGNIEQVDDILVIGIKL